MKYGGIPACSSNWFLNRMMHDMKKASKGKIKIGLFLGIEPTSGGTFQYNQTILDALIYLPQNEYEVVIGFSHKAWQQYLERYECSKVWIPQGSWGRIWGQLLHHSLINTYVWRRFSPYFHPAVKAFVQTECDLWIFPSQDPWCYLAPVPALATVHDLMHRYERRFPEVGRRREFSWREWHYRNTCRWSNGVLVDSKVGRQQVMESYNIPESKVHVLPYIAPSYLLEDNNAENLLSQYDLPDKFIFYPAQLWEHKNHKHLLQAIANLKLRFPDIHLVCVGAPKNAYRSTCRLVDQLGLNNQVHFLGYVSDANMNSLYRRARALVMPTFFGPTNIPPLEAMAVGCPVAVSDIYGMPEQTKGAALLFDPESVDEISDVIARLWDDDELCETLVKKGYQVYREWQQPDFNKYLELIIRSVLSGTSGS